MNNPYINEAELRKAIAQLKPDGELFEIRVLGGRNVYSGYFRSADVLIENLNKLPLSNATVYMTLNHLKDDLYSRQQHDCFISKANTTADDNVEGYEWLFIDLDPVRISGISSSAAELKASYELMCTVFDYMRRLGFNEPVQGMSGNGFHLLYPIALRNTQENVQLIQQCLEVLANMFNNEQVKIDTVNYNPSRICKLYGTLAQKGSDTEERPHRMSKLLTDVFDVKVNDRIYLEKLANELPAEVVKPSKTNNYVSGEFDLENWLRTYNFEYRTDSGRDCTIYSLKHCPFNHDHINGDSKVFHYSNGAIAFKCHHNSCSQYKWQDVRERFEPDAYSKTDDDLRIEEGWKQHNRDKAESIHYDHIVEETPNEPMFMTASMILAKPNVEEEYVRTGINAIDKRMKGLQKGHISVISGLRGAAKSTVLSQIILQCIENDHTAVVYSGELSDRNFLKWMMMQAAGKAYTQKYQKFDGYYCPDEIKPDIAKWMGDRLWLYNNNYGNDFAKIGLKLREEIKQTKADICIVDNLMALDLSDFSQDKYDAQTKFVWELKDIAQSCNVHVVFVAHPRKAQGFLRLDDISGSGNIANIVDNAFIVHRNNADFKRLTKQMFGWKDEHEAYLGTNVIEVCKDRETGIQDLYIPLWYEEESKRLKNHKAENIMYSWTDGFVPIGENMTVPF